MVVILSEAKNRDLPFLSFAANTAKGVDGIVCADDEEIERNEMRDYADSSGFG